MSGGGKPVARRGLLFASQTLAAGSQLIVRCAVPSSRPMFLSFSYFWFSSRWSCPKRGGPCSCDRCGAGLCVMGRAVTRESGRSRRDRSPAGRGSRQVANGRMRRGVKERRCVGWACSLPGRRRSRSSKQCGGRRSAVGYRGAGLHGGRSSLVCIYMSLSLDPHNRQDGA